MFFSPLDNLYAGFFALIVFIIVVMIIGDSLRSIFKISLINRFTDSLLLTLLFTNVIAIFFDIFNLFTHLLIYFFIILFIIIRMYLFYTNLSEQELMRTYFSHSANYIRRTNIVDEMKNKLKNITSIQVVFISLILYFIFFIIGPAIVYPLPLQTDMKHHTLFVYLMYSQQVVLPSWTPVAPTYTKVYYQLGGHVFTVWLYTLVSMFNIPVVTFVNFIFRFFFIALFIEIVLFVDRIYPSVKDSKLLIAVTLLLIPSLFFVTRWGGFSWLFGLFVFFYLVFISIKPLLSEQKVPSDIYLNQVVYIIGLALLGFFHINVLFYFFLYLLTWNIALLFKIIPFSKETFAISFTSILAFITYIIFLIFPDQFISFLPANIQRDLITASGVVPEGTVNFASIFISNFFIGGLIALIGLVIFVLNIKKKLNSYSLILIIWTILFISISAIIQVFRFNDFINTFLDFPGSQYMIKSQRMLYFSFIILIIYAPHFWQKFEPILNQTNKFILPIGLIILVVGFSFVSLYALQEPKSRNYNNYTMEGYLWIKNNVPENSYIMNDFYGQWLPLVAHVRISFPYDPLFLFSNSRTPYVFYELLLNENNATAFNSTAALLSPTIFNGTLNYIFITHHVFNDIQYKLGQTGLNKVQNRSIYELNVYPNLKLVYQNPDVAIYHIT